MAVQSPREQALRPEGGTPSQPQQWNRDNETHPQEKQGSPKCLWQGGMGEDQGQSETSTG